MSESGSEARRRMSEETKAAIEKRERETRGEPEPKESKKAKEEAAPEASEEE